MSRQWGKLPPACRRRKLATRPHDDSSSSSFLLAFRVAVPLLCLIGTAFAQTNSATSFPVSLRRPHVSDTRTQQQGRFLQVQSTSYRTQTFQFVYELYAPDVMVNATVPAIERQVVKSLRQTSSSSISSNLTWIQITNRDVSSAIGKCFDNSDEDPEGGFMPSDCHKVTTTIQTEVDARMEPLVVEQVALGNIRSFLTSYNSQQPDVFVEYVSPMLVTAVVRLTAVGLATAMNENRQDLFLGVFNQGFGKLMSSSNTDPRLTLRESRILYQVAPDTSDPGRQRSLRRLNQATASTAQKEDSSLQLSLMVRATCGTVACTSRYLRDFLMREGDQYGAAWVEGIHYQANTHHANNDAISTYFASLTKILFADAIIDENHSEISSVYDPAASLPEAPSWLWIALGVDGLIWFLALTWVAIKFRERNRHVAEDHSADQTIQSPGEHSHVTSMPTRQSSRRPRSRRKEAWKDEPSESNNESERMFDNGIRVRNADADCSQSGMDHTERDQSDHETTLLSQNSSRGNETSSSGSPPAGVATDLSKGHPPESAVYDDGVRISTDRAGQRSRIHDQGIHISNRIEDID